MKAQPPERLYIEKYAPFLRDTEAAYIAFSQAMDLLNEEQRNAAKRRFGAFALVHGFARKHCTSPYDLAGIEVIKDREDALVFFCLTNIVQAASSISTALLLFTATTNFNEQSRLVNLWAANAGKMAATAFQESRNLKFDKNCPPAHLAYIYIKNLLFSRCHEVRMEEVLEFLLENFNSYAKETQKNSFKGIGEQEYLAIQDNLISATFETIFRFVALHELFHLIESDPWMPINQAKSERNADRFALSTMHHMEKNVQRRQFDVTVAGFTVVYLGITAREWAGLTLGAEAERMLEINHRAACAIKDLVHFNPSELLVANTTRTLIDAHVLEDRNLNCEDNKER